MLATNQCSRSLWFDAFQAKNTWNVSSEKMHFSNQVWSWQEGNQSTMKKHIGRYILLKRLTIYIVTRTTEEDSLKEEL